MNKTTGIIIGIIIVVIAGIVYGSMRGGDSQMTDQMTDEKTVDSTQMEEKEVMMEDNNVEMNDTEAGSYEAYAPEKLERAKTGDVVLFFHASWCPSCRGLGADIEKNLKEIPSDLSILKVDYDTESELKKKYGVTYQHTLVQVSEDGTMIQKWSGSPTLNSLVLKIN